jgi:REP element-mobilizing transposase RayT
MPRPQRIEYENAFYHVMNRGRERHTIFHGDEYYQCFLDTIAQAQQRFKCIVHAYCLMGNHYHLLIETPNANLSRIMRHINGVYTQRYNRLKLIDGPLFRGRYKAILIDHEAYLLQLSRYIHRNPIETKVPLVEQLEDYPWSSYPAYVGKVKPINFLKRDTVYKMLGHKQHYEGYREFVMQGIDEQTETFHRKGNMSAVFGDEGFKKWVYEELLPELTAEGKSRVIQPNLTIQQVTEAVAAYYKTSTKELLKVSKGPQTENEARKIAMYLCQELAAAKLCEIAEYFNLNHTGSVSFITHQIRHKKTENEPTNITIEGLIKSLVNQVS